MVTSILTVGQRDCKLKWLPSELYLFILILVILDHSGVVFTCFEGLKSKFEDLVKTALGLGWPGKGGGTRLAVAITVSGRHALLSWVIRLMRLLDATKWSWWGVERLNRKEWGPGNKRGGSGLLTRYTGEKSFIRATLYVYIHTSGIDAFTHTHKFHTQTQSTRVVSIFHNKIILTKHFSNWKPSVWSTQLIIWKEKVIKTI